MSGLEALYFAYTIIWAGLFGYLVYLHRRQALLSKEIDLLKEMVEKIERK